MNVMKCKVYYLNKLGLNSTVKNCRENTACLHWFSSFRKSRGGGMSAPSFLNRNLLHPKWLQLIVCLVTLIIQLYGTRFCTLMSISFQILKVLYMSYGSTLILWFTCLNPCFCPWVTRIVRQSVLSDIFIYIYVLYMICLDVSIYS